MPVAILDIGDNGTEQNKTKIFTSRGVGSELLGVCGIFDGW